MLSGNSPFKRRMIFESAHQYTIRFPRTMSIIFCGDRISGQEISMIGTALFSSVTNAVKLCRLL